MNLFAMLSKALRRAPQKFWMFARAPKKWSNPSRAKIVIFDSTNATVLIPLFKGEHYEIVHGGWEEIYITPAIIFSTIRHALTTRDLMMAYVIAVLERIKPSIVVTFIDNSQAFQKTAQHYKTARFLAIQNGGRVLTRDNPPGSPAIYHSEFACLGKYEIDQYTEHGALVEKFYPIGSIKDSYYRSQRKLPSRAKRFDLCLVSQIKPRLYKTYPEQMKGLEILARHLKRFCEAHGTTLCIAARKHPERMGEMFEWECRWFQEYLGELPKIFSNVKEEYTSYSLIDSSTVSLGMHTTVLREGFGRRNRILSCNFTGNPAYDFPVKGVWALTDPAYEVFEERLSRLLKMSDEEYGRLCGDVPEYLVGYDNKLPTHVFLQNLIAEAVRGSPGLAPLSSPLPPPDDSSTAMRFCDPDVGDPGASHVYPINPNRKPTKNVQ